MPTPTPSAVPPGRRPAGLWQAWREEWRWYRIADGNISGNALRTAGFWVMVVFRFGHWARDLKIPVLGRLARAIYGVCRIIIIAMTGADVRPGATIGRRFTVHTSQGIIIANEAQIGDDCIINSGSCIVHRANDAGEGAATIGNHVRIGIGAKILGRVAIGDHVIIGANAVVISDVPSHCIAVGIPAQIKPRSKDVASADQARSEPI